MQNVCQLALVVTRKFWAIGGTGPAAKCPVINAGTWAHQNAITPHWLRHGIIEFCL